MKSIQMLSFFIRQYSRELQGTCYFNPQNTINWSIFKNYFYHSLKNLIYRKKKFCEGSEGTT